MPGSMNKNKAIKTVLLVSLLIIIVSVSAGLYLFYKKHADITKARPDFEITASELQKEFETNETASSQKFINKVLEVTGVISSINPSEGDKVNISLKTGNDMSSVICTLQDKAGVSDLRPGNNVTVRGECSGFLMDVLLNNCAIVNSH